MRPLSLLVCVAVSSFVRNAGAVVDSADPHMNLEPRTLPITQNLSILPLGDSITQGHMSTDGNGYRLDLKKLLEAGGQPSHYIGSLRSGENNPDNRMEGFGGQTISTILGCIQNDSILDQQPNIVLLHAGTNDMDFDNGYELEAIGHLGELIDFIFCEVDAIVLVAQLIENAWRPNNTALYNSQIPGLVQDRYLKGHKIQLVDMTPVTELNDTLHPTDAGYAHMARIWYSSMLSVPNAWWASSGEAATSCDGDPIALAMGGTMQLLLPAYHQDN